jgi:hypothetical protein
MNLLIQPIGTKTPIRIHLGELEEVRTNHMPAHAVRFAPLPEVERVATEVARKHPNLREEAGFVLAEEKTRRQQLSTPVLSVVR